MAAHSFTAASNYPIHAGTMTKFMGRSVDAVRDTFLQGAIRPSEFYVRAFSGSPMPETNPMIRVLRQRRAPTAGGPCDRGDSEV